MNTQIQPQILYKEIMAVIEKYNGAMLLPTVLGVLELAKVQLIREGLADLEKQK